MKLLVNSAYLSFLPENKVAVSFVTDERYLASKFVDSLQNIDKIELTAKEHKSSRTLEQNKLLWLIINAISDKLNGEHSHESTMKVYSDLLVRANVKRDLIAILPEAVETLKNQFRAVIPTNQTITSTNVKTGKSAQLSTYWVYHGSSTYNTKELYDLLEIAKNYAYQIGIESGIL